MATGTELLRPSTLVGGSTLQHVHLATDPKSAAELFAAIRSGLFRDLEITHHTLLIAILLSCPITL
ncbi:hypothetical protein [Streptomyces sp. NPDC088736]|uniref:hypothetical protein n=1 Tax=Streptomyces sp. NPDC088736 TaxID=3365881 RepID=UPI003803386E